jgi:hypothetical protein
MLTGRPTRWRGCRTLGATSTTAGRTFRADALERLGRFEESLADPATDVRAHALGLLLPALAGAPARGCTSRSRRPCPATRAPPRRPDSRGHAAAATRRRGGGRGAGCWPNPGASTANTTPRLVPLTNAFRADECQRGDTVVYRALLNGILDRAYARAYGHAARYWVRLGEDRGQRRQSCCRCRRTRTSRPRSVARHGRKSAFWAHVNGTRRDRHDDEDDLTPVAPIV